MGKRVRAAKTTFWNKLRVENDIKMTDIADMCKVSQGTVGNWFSGRQVPSEFHSNELSDLFGIDRNKGYQEFINSHKSWDSDRGRMKFSLFGTPPVCPKQTYKKKSKAKVEPKVESNPDLIEALPILRPDRVHYETVVIKDACRVVYGKLSYEDYEHFSWITYNGYPPTEITEFLYGKVEFEEYIEVFNLLNK